MPPGPSSTLAGSRRAVSVVILLVVTVAGLRARGPFSAAGNASLSSAAGRLATGVLAAAEGAGAVVCVLLLIMAFRRPRRRKRGDDPDHVPWTPLVPWWMRAFALLLALAVLAGPVALLIIEAHGRQSQRSGVPPALHPVAPPAGPGHAGPPAATPAWLVVAGMAVALAVALTLAVAARHGPARGTQPAERPPDSRSSLGASVLAGAEALHTGRDARQAIIACYAAMEQGLARAGSAPGAADTPAQVLARAAAAGLVRSSAAETLTILFRRARYSPHPVTTADRAAAADALERLRADLGRPRSVAGAPS